MILVCLLCLPRLPFGCTLTAPCLPLVYLISALSVVVTASAALPALLPCLLAFLAFSEVFCRSICLCLCRLCLRQLRFQVVAEVPGATTRQLCYRHSLVQHAGVSLSSTFQIDSVDCNSRIRSVHLGAWNE